MEIHDCQFLAVNGILTRPGDIDGWTDKAEDFWQSKGLLASKYEYGCGAATRFLFQGKRVKEVIQILRRTSRPVVYVGHSNGCEILSRVIRESRYTFPAVHLFAPAVQCDFKKNGFNTALKSGRIGKLFIYGSKNDLTLKYGNRFTGWLGGFGLGYGCLGQLGPENMDISVKERVILDWRDTFGHSTWWKPHKIKESLALTLRL